MNNFKPVQLNKIADFNPSESLPVGNIAKKVPMNMLKEFQRKISGYELAEYKSGPKFRNNDTLVAKITPCLENGKTAYVDILSDGEVAFGSSEYIVLRAKEKTFPEFLYYLAISPAFRARAISCMEGTSGRKRVNEGVLKLYELPIPCFEKQIKIANVLSALDKKIELNNRINAELEAMAKTLYDYWFVQFDFPISKEQAAAMGKPELEGKPYKTSGGKMVYNPTLKREIPEGWEAGTLEDLGQIVGGSTPSTQDPENFSIDGIPWITPNDLSNNQGNKFISRGDQDVSAEGIKNASLKKYPAGTVLLSSRAPIGYMAISRNEVTTNQGFKSFIPNKGYSSEFIYYTVKNSLKAITQYASGSTFKEVSGGTLKTVKIFLPGVTLSDAFTDKAKLIFSQQDNIEKENLKLAKIRDWLLPMLMNGQVTVSSEN